MPVIDISELPQNLQEIEAPPIRPGSAPLGAPPAKNDIPNYFSGTIAPQLQHDGTFVGMKYQTPGIPSHPVMPVAPSGQASINAAIISAVKNAVSAASPETQLSEMNWRGNWNSTSNYAIDDVVQFNISTYLALKQSTGVKPDSDTTTWALVSKNFNFRGQFGTGNPPYPPSFYWNANNNFSGMLTFAWALTPALPTWPSLHSVSLGFKIIDSNGNQQTVTTAGTTAVSPPTWATTTGVTTTESTGVVWTCGGAANAITIGDNLFMAAHLTAGSGTSTATITDSSGNVWTQIGTTQSYTSTLSGTIYSLQMWTTVATKNIPNNTSYTVTMHNSQSCDARMSIAGFSANVGKLVQSSSNVGSGTGPFGPGSITMDQQSFVVFASSTDFTTSPHVPSPPWNFISSVTGAHEEDHAWGVFATGISNPTIGQGSSGGLAATQSVYSNVSLYVPFDVVLFRGSTYVCISETLSSPIIAPSSWVLLSQGTGTINNLTGNYTALALDDGRLITNTSASNYTLTLPATPPTPWWWVAIQNSGTGTIVINPNGLNLDGSSSNLTLVQNQGVLIFNDGTNYFTERGFGTVFSVGLSLPGIFTVSGSPVTSAGTLTAILANEPANTVFAGPSSGGPAPPTFRGLTPADISGGTTNQSLSVNTVVYSDDYEVDVNGQPEITVNGVAPGAEMPSQGTGFGSGAAGTAVTTTTKGAGTGPITPQTIVKYVKVILDGTTFWSGLMQ